MQLDEAVERSSRRLRQRQAQPRSDAEGYPALSGLGYRKDVIRKQAKAACRQARRERALAGIFAVWKQDEATVAFDREERRTRACPAAVAIAVET